MSLPHAAAGGLSLTLLTLATAVAAEPPPLADQVAELRRQNAELARRLDTLEQRAPADTASPFRLIDLSLDVLFCAGASTANPDQLSGLHDGGHDPQRRGFTLQGAELSLIGAVDHLLTAEFHAVLVREEPSGETIVELEEAFARSTSLPWGLELKAGQYLTEFGRFNPTHPHSWAFLGQPIILGRICGGDGQRAPGVRLLGSLPTPWLSELILNTQNADGETCPSFLGTADTAVGGYPHHAGDDRLRLLGSARWINAWDAGDTMMKLGTSIAAGPSGGGHRRRSAIWGADLAAKWSPGNGRYVLVEAEFAERRYGIDAIDAVGSGADLTLGTGDDVASTAPGGNLRDHGVVVQAVWGFHPRWSAGLRYEHASGSGDGIAIDEDTGGGSLITATPRGADPLRCDRQRWSPLLAWQPSEFTHVRLQYDHDRSTALGQPAHSVWLGLEFLIGAHPAHTF